MTTAFPDQLGLSSGELVLAAQPVAVRGGRLGESALNLSPAVIDQFKVQMSFFIWHAW